MKEKIIENKGAKYSVMLYRLVQEFDECLPKALTFEETLEIGIEAWNLANNKEVLEKNNIYDKELKNHKYSETIDKMVSFKLDNFFSYNNIIVDYSTENERLQVKTQTSQNHFDSLLKKIILTNPNQTNKK